MEREKEKKDEENKVDPKGKCKKKGEPKLPFKNTRSIKVIYKLLVLKLRIFSFTPPRRRKREI